VTVGFELGPFVGPLVGGDVGNAVDRQVHWKPIGLLVGGEEGG